MKKRMLFEAINILLFILYSYIHVFYFSPYIYLFFHGRFASWGIWIIIAGVWGNIAKMILVKSFFEDEKYKEVNGTLIIIGVVMVIINGIQLLL